MNSRIFQSAVIFVANVSISLIAGSVGSGQTDFWSGSGSIGGIYYFDADGNWTDGSAPDNSGTAVFGNISQTIDWHASFGGDTTNVNLSVDQSQLIFRTADLPTKTHTITGSFFLSGNTSSLTLGDPSTPASMNMNAGFANFDNGQVRLVNDSRLEVSTLQMFGAFGSSVLLEDDSVLEVDSLLITPNCEIEIDGGRLEFGDTDISSFVRVNGNSGSVAGERNFD